MTHRTHAPNLRGAAIAALLAATAALTGCGGDTDTAPPAPKTTTKVAVSMHPCDVFTDAMLAGGYRSPKRYDRTAPHTELLCDYPHRNPGYAAGIHTVGRPFAEMVGNTKLVEREHLAIDGHDVSIGDASAITDKCIISIDIPPGTLEITVGYVPQDVGSAHDSLTTLDQACTEARKVLDIITPVLPDHT
jgi:Protein of unknown function (DUF3558)